MREYAKASPALYTGTLGAAISGDMDCLALAPYLIFGPHSNMIGLYRLPLAYVAEDLGMPSARASEALRKLSERGFCRYDESAKTVWVVEYARHEWGDQLNANDNRVKSLVKHLPKLLADVANSHLVQQFTERYCAGWSVAFEAIGWKQASPCQALAKPLPSPRGYQDQNQDQNQDQDQDQEQDPQSSRATVPDSDEEPGSEIDNLERFRALHPNPGSLPTLQRAWFETGPSAPPAMRRPPIDELLAILARQIEEHRAAAKPGEDGASFLKHGPKWLKDAEWTTPPRAKRSVVPLPAIRSVLPDRPITEEAAELIATGATSHRLVEIVATFVASALTKTRRSARERELLDRFGEDLDAVTVTGDDLPFLATFFAPPIPIARQAGPAIAKHGTVSSESRDSLQVAS